MRRRAIAAAAAAGLVMFLAGWGASDIVKAGRIVVMNEKGETRVSIGTDQTGAGFLIVTDENGKDVFAVRGQQVYLPRGADAAIKPGAERAPVGSGNQVAQLVRIESIEADPAILDQVADLRDRAADLKDQQREAEQDTARLVDEQNVGKHWDPPTDHSAKIAELQKRAADLRKEAGDAEAKAARLEREAKAKRQRIWCWDGQREIVLETKGDLSAVLTKIPARGFLTWKGIRKGMERDVEEFEVTSISPAPRPDGFTDRRD